MNVAVSSATISTASPRDDTPRCDLNLGHTGSSSGVPLFVPFLSSTAPTVPLRIESGGTTVVRMSLPLFVTHDGTWLRGEVDALRIDLPAFGNAPLHQFAHPLDLHRGERHRGHGAGGGVESPDPLVALGASPRQVVDLHTREDQRLLERRPDGLASLAVQLWIAPAPALG